MRDIAAEAGVSYPTFFKHYDGKDDLFQDIARSEISDFLTEGFRSGVDLPDWRPGVGICAFVAERRSLWRTLLTAGASDVMRAEFIRRGREIPRSEPNLGHGFPLDLISGVIASGVFEIVAWWLWQEDGHPIAEIADMLETLVIEPALGCPPGYFTKRPARRRS